MILAIVLITNGVFASHSAATVEPLHSEFRTTPGCFPSPRILSPPETSSDLPYREYGLSENEGEEEDGDEHDLTGLDFRLQTTDRTLPFGVGFAASPRWYLGLGPEARSLNLRC